MRGGWRPPEVLDETSMRRLVVLSLFLAAGLTACAAARPCFPRGDGPLLSLSPGSLGGELHLAQRVTVLRGDSTWAFDALLEADALEVRLAAFVMGQTVLRLRWDGRTLEEEHSARTPEVITPARILSDVQLAFWPSAAIREGLPQHFTLDEGSGERVVTQDGRPFARLHSVGTPPGWSRVELSHQAYGYRLIIESKEAP